MELSKLPGGTKECSSSESGWTMYIASPIHQYHHEDEDDDDDDERTSRKRDKNLYDDDDDGEDVGSDDSLVSDASSGPGHQEVCTTIDKSHGKLRLKHAEKETKKFPSKEYNREVKKKLFDMNIKAAKEDSGHKSKIRIDYASSRSTSRRKYVN
ncbi:protein SOB FIVE-LIKE 2 [Lycium barbarum]|uniref:protein SOB FIVE-LIKE 2 n=1 Tax=Lycium barbarum TaxID=112863 RepID=UPI00293E8EE7|nr:protein SOB FIVE-LIKE 2 [Lycium barbarum]